MSTGPFSGETRLWPRTSGYIAASVPRIPAATVEARACAAAHVRADVHRCATHFDRSSSAHPARIASSTCDEPSGRTGDIGMRRLQHDRLRRGVEQLRVLRVVFNGHHHSVRVDRPEAGLRRDGQPRERQRHDLAARAVHDPHPVNAGVPVPDARIEAQQRIDPVSKRQGQRLPAIRQRNRKWRRILLADAEAAIVEDLHDTAGRSGDVDLEPRHRRVVQRGGL